MKLVRANVGTLVAWEERGVPIEYFHAYGAGIQIHVDDLGDHLAGRERRDADERFAALLPAYEATRAGSA